MEPNPSDEGRNGGRKLSIENDGLRNRKSSNINTIQRQSSSDSDSSKSKVEPLPGPSKANNDPPFKNSFGGEPSTSSIKTDEKKNNTSNAKKDNGSENSGSFPFNTSQNYFPNFGGFNPSTSNFPFSSPSPKKNYANSEEYFNDLRQWLQQAFFWQSVVSAFPYFMMCQQFGQTSAPMPTSFPTTFQPPSNANAGMQFPFPQPGFQYPRQEQPVSRPSEVVDGVECRIPSFWKRIAAEFIDFLLLFFVKIAVTYVAVDFFHFVEMDTLDLFQKDVKLAYKTFIQITQDIVILEMIHRLVVCAFETFWLIGGQNGRLGGATPGKSIMGLRVLTCDSSAALREGDDRVVVKPGGNLGLGAAFFRALTKNFVLALLIPTSFAFIFFPHNRTGYDMICNTIVVEEPIVPHRVQTE